MKIGTRVELHPGCDLWMRGAKFGTVTFFNKKRGTVTLKMDHPQVRRPVRVSLERVTEVRSSRF